MNHTPAAVFKEFKSLCEQKPVDYVNQVAELLRDMDRLDKLQSYIKPDGENALFYAVRTNLVPVVELLLDYGFAPDARRLDGWQPVHVAAAEGDGVMLALLFRRGASALAYTNMNKKPSDYASERGHDKIVTFLLSREKSQIANEKSKRLVNVFKSSIWCTRDNGKIFGALGITLEGSKKMSEDIENLYVFKDLLSSRFCELLAQELYTIRSEYLQKHDGKFTFDTGLVVTEPLAKAFFIWIIKFLKSNCNNGALDLIPKNFKIGEICAVFASSNPRETGKYEYHTDDAIVNLNFCIESKELRGGELEFSAPVNNSSNTPFYEGDSASTNDSANTTKATSTTANTNTGAVNPSDKTTTTNSVVHSHEVGALVIHPGNLSHRVAAVTNGKRLNILVRVVGPHRAKLNSNDSGDAKDNKDRSSASTDASLAKKRRRLNEKLFSYFDLDVFAYILSFVPQEPRFFCSLMTVSSSFNIALMHPVIWRPLVAREFCHYNEEERKKLLQSESSAYDFWYRLYLNLEAQTLMKLPLPYTMKKKNEYNNSKRLLIFGNPRVGKSAFVIRTVTGHFVEDYADVDDSFRKRMMVDQTAMLVELMDYGSHETDEFSLLMFDQYARGADGYILCFSVTDRESFQNCTNLLKMVLRYRDAEYVPTLLLGCKNDLKEERVVSKEEGKSLAKHLGAMRYHEFSAKLDKDNTCSELVCECVRGCFAYDSYMAGDFKIEYRDYLPLSLGKMDIHLETGKKNKKNKKEKKSKK